MYNHRQIFGGLRCLHIQGNVNKVQGGKWLMDRHNTALIITLNMMQLWEHSTETTWRWNQQGMMSWCWVFVVVFFCFTKKQENVVWAHPKQGCGEFHCCEFRCWRIYDDINIHIKHDIMRAFHKKINNHVMFKQEIIIHCPPPVFFFLNNKHCLFTHEHSSLM